MRLNSKIAVHAYKYDGCLYRTYEFPKIIDETDEYICLSLHNIHIISQAKNKKFYHSHSKNESYWFLFKEKWMNLFISKNFNDEVLYYFNIASPFIYEEGAIKYIDLDLDIRVNDVGRKNVIKLLDENEFKMNFEKMLYPKKLINKTIEVRDEIVELLKQNYYQEKFNLKTFDKYRELN